MTEETGVTAGLKESSVDSAKMHFILKGFSQTLGFRVFAFDGIAADHTRTPFWVRTDLELTRRYGIRLQELPLLCREVLERDAESDDRRAFTYTEQDMCLHADMAAARAEAARKRKPAHRPASSNLGAAWRVPPR